MSEARQSILGSARKYAPTPFVINGERINAVGPLRVGDAPPPASQGNLACETEVAVYGNTELPLQRLDLETGRATSQARQRRHRPLGRRFLEPGRNRCLRTREQYEVDPRPIRHGMDLKMKTPPLAPGTVREGRIAPSNGQAPGGGEGGGENAE